MISRAVPRSESRALSVLVLLVGLSGSRLLPVRATGDFDQDAVPTLPYYLDRLPAKSPAEVFLETSAGDGASARPTDYGAALLGLANDAERAAGGAAPAPILAKLDALLASARTDPEQSGPLCNLLNDLHDLFTAAPAVAGKEAAGYIRWRAAHPDWFGVTLDAKKKVTRNAPDEGDHPDAVRLTRTTEVAAQSKRAGARSPLRVHWDYLNAALAYPGANSDTAFRQIIQHYPDHPRAESARFMLGRCLLSAARAREQESSESGGSAAAEKLRKDARDAFEDYLKRYPSGRFVGDTKGWLGAIAFDQKDYLAALNFYLEQAATPGQPPMLKSAGFMCERCLSHLSADANDKALAEIAARPRLAMSLIYLIVNTSESDNYNGALETPEQVLKWRRALLPRLAREVAAHENAYHDGAASDWQGRYLAILAQAASGTGDQPHALAICDMAKADLDRSDDLAFIHLVALQRARKLPEAIAAGRAFARQFPRSPLARGAALRFALALQDNHQAGLALVELTRLAGKPPAEPAPADDDADAVDYQHGHLFPANDNPSEYPLVDAELDASRSVLRHDVTGAERDQITQICDALLCFAPLAELSPALDAGKSLGDGSALLRWRAVLAQRWLGEEENFTEAKKYLSAAQWTIAAAPLEKLAAAAAAKPDDADGLVRLADGWAVARGKLVFAPLETDQTRNEIFAGGSENAGLNRRTNGLALGFAADAVDRALDGHDEMHHAVRWWLRAADAAPAGSPTRARALWSALKALPGIASATPYQLTRANETKMAATSRQLYDRLRRECPDSREAREFAVYYDIPAPAKPAASNEETTAGANNSGEETAGDPSTKTTALIDGEPEYLYSDNEAFGKSGGAAADDQTASDTGNVVKRIVALHNAGFTSNPKRMAAEVASIRKEFRALAYDRADTGLQNLLDDLADLLKEDPAKLTPDALKRYVDLRIECLHVEGWFHDSSGSLPPVPGVTGDPVESADATENNAKRAGLAPKALGSGSGVDDAVFNHVRAAYKAPGLAPLKDYLDFLALAVIANHRIVLSAAPTASDVPEGFDKDGQGTDATRDYPKLAKLTEGFLTEHPRSGKREAVRLLYARALYNASRPTLYYQYAVWPESGHFDGHNVIRTHRREPFDARKIGEALNASAKEFPGGRYSAEIRDLRALLAWRTQDWKIALDLTLAALDDKRAPDLQERAALRLANIFSDGLADETERSRLLAAVKAQPGAKERLRQYLPKSDYPVRMLKSWVEAQL